ncbi:MAG TPA: hypothetical protein VNE86_05550 [Nitrososphaerales archaeon]|nr:hypothetical protein [Nitrososphaerales archaeon]
MTKTDLELFQELGLTGCRTIDSCENVLQSLRMRQLDMLKIVLSRLAKEECFSFEIADGVRKNDLRMFARAILLLNNNRLENAN